MSPISVSSYSLVRCNFSFALSALGKKKPTSRQLYKDGPGYLNLYLANTRYKFIGQRERRRSGEREREERERERERDSRWTIYVNQGTTSWLAKQTKQNSRDIHSVSYNISRRKYGSNPRTYQYLDIELGTCGNFNF